MAKPETKAESPAESAKTNDPPRYCKSAAACVAHFEYCLGKFNEVDSKRIMAFVADGQTMRFAKPATPTAPGA